MFEDDFFLKAPQEFFASIANQWFASTEHTLLLAITRFNNGYNEPLNQFFFFADTYSCNHYTLFYETDTLGNINCKKIPITFDDNDYIDSMKINKTIYRFNKDEKGYVLDYSIVRTTLINDTENNIFNAAFNSVYYVPTGNIYDDSSMYAFYAYKENPQIITAPTQNPSSDAYLDETGKPLFTGNIITFGGRCANRLVKYFEDRGIAVIGYENNGTHHIFTRVIDGLHIYAIDMSTYDETEKDYFVMQSYNYEDHCVLSEWGISAAGTYAGGLCFIDIIWPNIQSYIKSYYIYSWTDINDDDMPQSNEITLETSGS